MTYAECANKLGISVAELRRQSLEFLQCEGYDDAGHEYDTLDAWIERKPIMESIDQIDGGRGSGCYGKEVID